MRNNDNDENKSASLLSLPLHRQRERAVDTRGTIGLKIAPLAARPQTAAFLYYNSVHLRCGAETRVLNLLPCAD